MQIKPHVKVYLILRGIAERYHRYQSVYSCILIF